MLFRYLLKSIKLKVSHKLYNLIKNQQYLCWNQSSVSRDFKPSSHYIRNFDRSIDGLFFFAAIKPSFAYAYLPNEIKHLDFWTNPYVADSSYSSMPFLNHSIDAVLLLSWHIANPFSIYGDGDCG
jgi:hypothetical protein